jgi:murein DD-endopeptidase MepM/ murein hydrolase activator NlpD
MARRPLLRARLRLWLALACVLLGLHPALLSIAQTPTPEPPTYVVQPGDTLFEIAQRAGTTVEELVALNQLADPDSLEVGQVLRLPSSVAAPAAGAPPTRSRWHTVQPGETLPGLALHYGITLWDLIATNDLSRPWPLLPGQELLIPPIRVVTDLTPRFPTLSAEPVVQGQTLLVELRDTGSLEVDGWLAGEALTFVFEGGRYWALMGIDPLARPQAYPLVIEATEILVEGQPGDDLTLRAQVQVLPGDFSSQTVYIPADRQGLLAPDLSREERIRVNAVFSGVNPYRHWGGAFGYPLDGELRITAPFGDRRSYNGGPFASYHSGIDIGSPAGTPVYAPATATVALAEPLQVRGNAVILDHGWGVFTAFWHLSEIHVAPGDVVTRGQVVGLVGNTGLSTAAHLHWEMRVANTPVDPLEWTRRAFP